MKLFLNKDLRRCFFYSLPLSLGLWGIIILLIYALICLIGR